MRAIVVGGSGQIGGWLLHHLRARGHDAIGTFASRPFHGLVPFDAANPNTAEWIAAQRADVVFYPAGFTWVDGCERDPARARSANVTQPLMVARAAAKAGGRFVYYSTDYLFDGVSGPYQESDASRPLNVYGEAKLEAERALLEALGPSVLVIRTCWVFGPERQGKNFAYQVVRTLAAGKPLVCPNDQFANPSYGPDVAFSSVRAAELGRHGLMHIAGPDWIDRVMFARMIAGAFGLDSSSITGQSTADLGGGSPRPLKGGLVSSRGDIDMVRSTSEALADFRVILAEDPTWADPLHS